MWGYDEARGLQAVNKKRLKFFVYREKIFKNFGIIWRKGKCIFYQRNKICLSFIVRLEEMIYGLTFSVELGLMH